MDGEDDSESWPRATWARWYLDRDDVAAAAGQLAAGNDLELDEVTFSDLARALYQRGLATLYEDGRAFVYTPQDALEVLAEIERDGIANGGRFPPARSPAPEKLRRPAIRADHAERAGSSPAAGRSRG